MIIEIDLSLKEGDERNDWKSVFNTDQLCFISTTYEDKRSFIELNIAGNNFRFRTFNEANALAIYQAFKFALQGQAVKLDSWGHISPLVDAHEYWNQRRIFAKDVIEQLKECYE
jgi:hypothetical protein